jgi:phosphoribosyl-AMP cyclohydrolase
VTATEAVTDGVIRFGADGLVPAVLQDAVSRRVLMVGFMDATALAATRETGLVHFWSRSRARLWQKGETSGNVSRVRELRTNCEQNSLLLLVEQVGAICHDGYPTCFYRRVEADDALTVVEPRAFDPADVYGEAAGRRPDATSVFADWYAAYEYLRDHDLASESSTSGRLRSGEDVSGRVADELVELAGVLDGTHRHDTPERDVALEGGQVMYWLALSAVGRRCPLSLLRLAETVASAGSPTGDGAESEAETLRALADRWRSVGGGGATPLLGRTTVAAVTRSVALFGVDVTDLVRADLDELRGRPYLAGWAGRAS